MSEALEQEIEGLRGILNSARDPDGRAFVPLADAYRRARDLERALDVLTEGLERHPDFASAWVVLARVHRDRGDREGARTALARVLELDDENVEALRGMGTLLVDSGRAAEAGPYLERARTLDPGVVAEPMAVAAGAETLLASEGPRRIPESIEEEEPVELPATRTLAELFVRQGLHDRAIGIYERLVEERPDDAALSERLGALRARAHPVPAAHEAEESPEGVEEAAADIPRAPDAVRDETPDEDDEALARELAEPVPAPIEVTTPFAWSGGELDSTGDEEGGRAASDEPSIAAYLGGVLGWTRGTPEAPRATAHEPQAVSIGSLAPEAVPIESLAPDAVPIESLAPDASSGPSDT